MAFNSLPTPTRDTLGVVTSLLWVGFLALSVGFLEPQLNESRTLLLVGLLFATILVANARLLPINPETIGTITIVGFATGWYLLWGIPLANPVQILGGAIPATFISIVLLDKLYPLDFDE